MNIEIQITDLLQLISDNCLIHQVGLPMLFQLNYY